LEIRSDYNWIEFARFYRPAKIHPTPLHCLQLLPSVWPVAPHDGHSDHSLVANALRMMPGHLGAYGSGRPHFLPISSNDLTTARQRGQIPTGRASFSVTITTFRITLTLIFIKAILGQDISDA
jgi:hypothetical protein